MNTDQTKFFNLKGPVGTERFGALIPYFPIFWTWVFLNLCRTRPKCVHACDLSTVVPSYLYKVLFRKRLVFDIFDRYAMAFIPRNRNIFFRIFYSVVNRLEDDFANRSDVLINVSDEALETFGKKSKRCLTIMNCSEDHLANRSKLKSEKFKILFTGHIRKGRGLELLPEIMNDLKGVQVLITGRVEDKKLLASIEKIPNTKYLGFLDHKQVLDTEVSSDVMMALYDLNLEIQNKFVFGNKLFEAMMCGTPIITNVACTIVDVTKCGIVVNYENTKCIREAIVKLRDNPDLTDKLGNNGRRAFLENYNWSAMEKKLFTLYDNLLAT